MRRLLLAVAVPLAFAACGPVNLGGAPLPAALDCPAPWHRCGDACWPGGTECADTVTCGDACWACADGLVPWCASDGAPVCCDADQVACADDAAPERACAGSAAACGAGGVALPPAHCGDL